MSVHLPGLGSPNVLLWNKQIIEIDAIIEFNIIEALYHHPPTFSEGNGFVGTIAWNEKSTYGTAFHCCSMPFQKLWHIQQVW